jgi:hypothetical protein
MATSAIPSTHIENLVAGKIAAGTIASVVNISGVFTAVGGGTPEAVFNKTLAAGDWRMDMGPVADTGATYLLRYYNGYDDAHGSYAEAFSIDDAGNAKFSGDLAASSFITATSGQRIEINPAGDNEIHFYGDNGAGTSTIEELASIGIKTVGSDVIIHNIGSSASQRTCIRAESYNKTAIIAITQGNHGIFGSGGAVGVVGQTASSVGAGVEGQNLGSGIGVRGGGFIGVQGKVNGSTKIGVHGENSAGATGAGVYGFGGFCNGVVAETVGANYGAFKMVPRGNTTKPALSGMGEFTVLSDGTLHFHNGTSWIQIA